MVPSLQFVDLYPQGHQKFNVGEALMTVQTRMGGMATLISWTTILALCALLVLLFGYAPGVAVATDLLFAAVTKTCGVAVHYRAGTIDRDRGTVVDSPNLPGWEGARRRRGGGGWRGRDVCTTCACEKSHYLDHRCPPATRFW